MANEKNKIGDIFSILKTSNELLVTINNKFKNPPKKYSYSGTSVNNELSVKLNEQMILTDFYKINFIKIIPNVENVDFTIFTNSIKINNTDNTYNNMYPIYIKDKFNIYHPTNSTLYDTINPLPNPIIFKSSIDFFIIFELIDRC